MIVLAVVQLTACGKSDSGPSTSPGSAPAPAPQAPPPPPPPVAPPDAAAATPADADAVAQLVVADVGSKALGSQKIEASCVSVAILPAGDWTVASAKLKDCGNKTAKSILWLFKRPTNGKWSEDYAGTPPKCWQNVPPDIVDAVAKVTKIPGC